MKPISKMNETKKTNVKHFSKKCTMIKLESEKEDSNNPRFTIRSPSFSRYLEGATATFLFFFKMDAQLRRPEEWSMRRRGTRILHNLYSAQSHKVPRADVILANSWTTLI